MVVKGYRVKLCQSGPLSVRVRDMSRGLRNKDRTRESDGNEAYQKYRSL